MMRSLVPSAPTLFLPQEAPLAEGGFRLVFQHPQDERLLVKVLRRAGETTRQNGKPRADWRSFGIYTPYMRELREYVAMYSRLNTCPPIVQRCFGFVDTDRGLGMVVEKLTDRNGQLAPSVATYVAKHGMTERLDELCRRFYEELRQTDIIVSDLNPRNIVWASDGNEDRLVLVDGLGEKTLIPLRSISKAFNRYQINRYIIRSLRRIDVLVAKANMTRRASEAALFDLSGLSPLASGRMRDVFRDPEKPDRLVKVFRPDRVNPLGNMGDRKRSGRYGAYDFLLREMREMIAWSHRTHNSPGTLPPFAIPYGLLSTTRGTGLVVESIQDEQGDLAPTLDSLIEDGKFGPQHARALDQFFDICSKSHVVLCSTHLKNLVYTTARTGKPEVVSIDGIGEKTFMPIHVWSKRMNAVRIERLRKRAFAAIRSRKVPAETPGPPATPMP